MSAAYFSGMLVTKLLEARSIHRQRVGALNRVAEGEVELTPDQRSSLKHSEKKIRELLEELAEGVVHRSRVVTMEEVAAEREALPKGLREQYELLWCRAYGSDPAVSVGDANVIRGVGKRTTRSDSGQKVNVPGAPTATKKFGSNQRNVIQNRRAYDFKNKVDRKLRRISHDIEEELAGRVTIFKVNICSHCARLGDEDWRFCPSCGGTMKEEER